MAGNQLAVVLDAADLDTQTMQAIARETNFSETTFVCERTSTGARVRIFTPTHELPFAGHPTLGTAWVISQLECNPPASDITLQLGVGDVPVQIDFQSDIVWLEAPAVRFGEGISVQSAAKLLNLEENDFLTSAFPIQSATAGPSFQLIAIRNRDALGSCRINTDAFMEFQAQGDGVQGLFVFTPDGYGQASDFAARMFFEADGVREDPATGSANCCFAAYLQVHAPDIATAIVDQGVEMGRPSTIYLQLADVNRVGGKVQHVFSGELHL